MNQTRNKTEYDENFSTCYAITNISSDLWNSGNNNTYFEFRSTLSCGESPAPQTPSGSSGRGSTKPECNLDSDCKKGYSCYSGNCVKLFDVKIIKVEPLTQNLSFPLTYLIKGMANIKGDVIIKFWLEKDSKKTPLGQDAIYLGSFEEKTETTNLNLPKNIENGDYDLYVQINFENYSVESFRKININLPKISLENETERGWMNEEKPFKPEGMLESIKNLFSNMKKGFSSSIQFVSNNKIYFFVGLGIFTVVIILTGLIVLIRNLSKRKPRDMAKLRNLKGLRVYSENGNYIGRLKETYLEDGKAQIYGYLIKLNKKIAKKIRKRNILVRHKHMRAVKHIMIIDESVGEHLEKLGPGST